MVIKIILMLIYLAMVFYLGYKGWRETKEASDYMLAGRTMNPLIVALSYGATFISTSAIIGFGGAAGLYGFSLLWLTFLNIMVGVFAALVFFGKRTRRMGIALDAHTFPELLGQRYQSRFVQGFAGLVLFCFIPVYAAAVLIGISRMLEASVMEVLAQSYGLTPTPELAATVFSASLITFSVILALYVISGGLKAVMYTDAFQAAIVLVMMVILALYTYGRLGGLINAHQALTDLAQFMPAGLKKAGLPGWTQGAEFGSPLWLYIYTTLIYGVGLGVLAQPQLAVRFMTVKSDLELNRAVLYGSLFVLTMTGVAFVVGALSNAVFYKTFGLVPVEGLLLKLKDSLGLYTTQSGGKLLTPAIGIVMGQGNVDAIIPAFVEKVMPDWFSIFFLLAMFAAGMSTLSSQYQVGGTALGRDFYEMSLGLGGQGGEILVTRIGVALTIIFTLIWGYALPPGIIAAATAYFFGLCAAVFLPAYFLGLYWRGMTRAGAAWSMAGGFLVSLFFLVFVHRAEASSLGLGQALFGRSTLVAGTSWAALELVDPNLIALPASLLLAVLVSLFTAKMPEDHLDMCWKFI
ncbi:MAG: sodium:solute symporter family protein [Thermodesulfobacteriota bacterium]